MKPFEIIDHTADIGIRAYGKDLKELFSNAAAGTASIIAQIQAVHKKESRYIEITAYDLEELLVGWLNEIVYLFSAHKFLTSGVSIEYIDNKLLKGYVYGECYDAKRHTLQEEIKSTTYHMINIKKPESTDDLWTLEVIFDV